MKALKFLLLIVLTSVFACNNKTIQVYPLESTQNKSNGIIYSLPRTVVAIKVDVKKTLIIPGPYAQYAQKYLGIAGVSTQRSEDFEISSITIDSKNETDPTALYSAFINKNSIFDFFQIVNTGLILPIDDYNTFSLTSSKLQKVDIQDVSYTDLSVNPYIAEEKSTFYSKVQRDSSFVRVPVQKSMIIEKNNEEKAKEAAEFIFTLRKKRLEFMTIDVDQPLDGEALKAMFAEISRLENEYLSLFIGKLSTETISKTILYTPIKPEGESSIAFRFSPSKGVVATNDLSGNPILIELEPEVVPESYSNLFSTLNATNEKTKFDQVYYRIPNSALVKVSDGKNELASRRMLIYQYGSTAKLPIEHLLIKSKKH